MTRIRIEGEAIDDLVLSSHSAAAAGHETMTRVPGAALLGAAARKLYQSLASDDAWTVFHSGRFRFGDLRPLHLGLATVPMPRSWHRPKGGRQLRHATGAAAHSLLTEADLVDFAHPGERDASRKALRTGYVTAGGHWVHPRLRSHTKSARDPEQRRARDQFLFSSQALASGSRFGGWLSWDDDVPEALVGRVQDALLGDGPIHVGRSRSAEFGRLQLTGIDSRRDLSSEEVVDPSGRRLTVLLLSDVALSDPEQGPTLRPTSELLGLPPGRMEAEHCYVAARRYRPFNGHRRRPDLARTVLAAGSVLALELETPLPPSEARRLSLLPLGLHTQEGLGEVLFSPAILAGVRPSFAPVPAAAVATAEIAAGPATLDDPLARWALARVSARRADSAAVAAGDDAVARVLQLLEKSVRDDREGDRLELWPPTTQWNRLARVVDQAETLEQLQAGISDVVNSGVAHRLWGLELWRSAGTVSLGDLVTELAADRRRERSVTQATIRRLCRYMTQWLHTPAATAADGGDA